MNKAIIMGRLTRDPELKTLKDNVSVCTVTVAVDRRYKSSTGERQTDFIPVVFWNQQAEFVSRYFAKGSRISLVGRIQVRNYEDAEGKKRTATEIVAEDVEFVDSKQNSPAGQDSPSQSYTPPSGGFGRQSTPSTTRPSQEGGFVPTPDDDISLPFDLDP